MCMDVDHNLLVGCHNAAFAHANDAMLSRARELKKRADAITVARGGTLSGGILPIKLCVGLRPYLPAFGACCRRCSVPEN